MFFEKRAYQLGEIETPEELARKLTEYTWCGCQGWKIGGVLFLNDATCADGAQEYAAIIEPSPGEYFQVESITFSWCTYNQAVRAIKRCLEYAQGEAEPPMRKPVTVNLNHGKTCSRCA